MARRGFFPYDAILIGLLAPPRHLTETVFGIPISLIPVIAGVGYGAKSSARDAVITGALSAIGVALSASISLYQYIWLAFGLGAIAGAYLLVEALQGLAQLYAILALIAIFPLGAVIASFLIYLFTATVLSVVVRAGYEVAKLVAGGIYNAVPPGPVRGFVALLVTAYTVGIFVFPGIMLITLSIQYTIIAILYSQILGFFFGNIGPVMTILGIILGILMDSNWLRWLRAEANAVYAAFVSTALVAVIMLMLGLYKYIVAIIVASTASLLASPPRRLSRAVAAASFPVTLITVGLMLGL